MPHSNTMLRAAWKMQPCSSAGIRASLAAPCLAVQYLRTLDYVLATRSLAALVVLFVLAPSHRSIATAAPTGIPFQPGSPEESGSVTK